MLRHYRARHENEVPDTPRIDAASRKQMLDEAVLSFMVKDCQPLSIVESEEFRELIQALQPSCFANQKDHQTNAGEKVRGGTGTSEKGSTACCGNNLWQPLDIEVGRQTKNATADAIQEVQRYLAEGNIARSQDPLRYWDNQKASYPNLFQLALEFLCTPASSVPCERVFSTAGEVVSKKCNHLNFKTLEELIFLNKNL
ncbi:zinc finger BED domain-containing protein 4-like [Pholidichthys leucotaenia]